MVKCSPAFDFFNIINKCLIFRYGWMDTSVHITHDEDGTVELGRQFAQQLVESDVVALYGDLGAGKTEFVRGICEYFQVGEIVSSPTFTIINQYSGAAPESEDEVKIYHVDLYRINSKRELEEIGFNECMMSNDCIKLIEWADKANGSLPRRRYSVIFRLNERDENERTIEIRHSDESDVEETITLEQQA